MEPRLLEHRNSLLFKCSIIITYFVLIHSLDIYMYSAVLAVFTYTSIYHNHQNRISS